MEVRNNAKGAVNQASAAQADIALPPLAFSCPSLLGKLGNSHHPCPLPRPYALPDQLEASEKPLHVDRSRSPQHLSAYIDFLPG